MTVDYAAMLAWIGAAMMVGSANLRRNRRPSHWITLIAAVVFVGVAANAAWRVPQWSPWQGILATSSTPQDLLRFVEALLKEAGASLFGSTATVADDPLGWLFSLMERTLGLTVLLAWFAVKWALRWPTGHLHRRWPETVSAPAAALAYDKEANPTHLRRSWVFILPSVTWLAFVAGFAGALHAGGVLPPATLVPQFLGPTLAFIVIAEFAWFLAGSRPPALSRASDEVQTEARQDSAGVDLAKLRDCYLELWPSELSQVHESAVVADNAVSSRTPLGILLQQHANLVIADDLLVHYRDELADFITTSILQGDRVLMVVSAETEISPGIAWLSELLAGSNLRIDRIHDRLGQQSAQVADLDILVATIRQPIEDTVRIHWKDHRALILVLEAHKTAIWHAPEFRVLREELHFHTGELPRFIGFSDWREGLEESLRNAAGTSLQDVVQSVRDTPTFMLLWPLEQRATSQGYYSERLGLDVRAMPEMILALPALAHQVQRVVLADLDRTPWRGSRNEVENTITSIRIDGAGVEPSICLGSTTEMTRGFHALHRDHFDGVVEEITAPWSITTVQQPQAVVIVRDDAYNLLWAANKWAKLAETETMLHIIAPPYLYRDWLVHTIHDIGVKASRRRITPLAPESSDSSWSKAYRLYRTLNYRDMTVPELDLLLRGIEAEIDLPGASENSLAQRLESVLRRELGHDLYVHLDFKRIAEFTADGPRTVTKVSNSMYSERSLPGWMQLVEIRGRESGAEPLAIVYAGELTQRYLPGQTHVFGGDAYRIESMTQSGTIAVVEARAERLSTYHEMMRPHLEYDLCFEKAILVETYRKREDDDHRGDVEITRWDVPTTATVRGYLSFEPRYALDLARGDYKDLNEPRESKGFSLERRYEHGKVLRLRFYLPQILDDVDRPRLAFTLALLLNEAFVTHFPEVHPFIKVASARRPTIDPDNRVFGRRLLGLVPDIRGIPSPDHQHIDLYVVEDTHFDIGAARSVATAALDKILPEIRNYVTWALERPDNEGAGAFLAFGQTSINGIYIDLDGAKRTLDQQIGLRSAGATGNRERTGDSNIAGDHGTESITAGADEPREMRPVGDLSEPAES